MKKIKEQIKKYMLQGYSVNEVVSMIDKEKQAEYECDVDKLYRTVTKVFELVRSSMTAEEKETLKELRKKHAEKVKYEKCKRIADKVKEIAEKAKPNYSSLKDALAYAIQSVARTEALTKDIVRTYTRTIYPDFYDYYNKNLDVTPEQLVAMAELIISKNMYKSIAEAMKHYPRMLKYIAENRPDLLEKIKAVYASHNNGFGDFSFDSKKSVFENYEMLEQIICEFRPSLNILLDFINKAGIFTKSPITTQEELAKILCEERSSLYINAIRWYVSEASVADDFTEYRNARFEFFVNGFFALDDFEDRVKYTNVITAIDLRNVRKKIAEHEHNNSYGFTLEDNRQLVRWSYNYALTRIDLEKALFGKKVDKSEFIEKLSKSDDLYDQMLVDGARRLNDHYQDIENNIRSGRI